MAEEMIATLMTAHAPPLKNGPPDALMRAAAELRPLIRAVIAAMLHENREHPDVEDCTHETLRRAIEGRSRLRDGEPVRPWLTGIARHVALDALRARKKAKQRAAPDGPEDADDAPSAVERLADGGPTPFERVSGAQEATAIQRALEALPDRQREALVMFHMEGLAYQEIASRLEVPLGTVATWVTRARKSLAVAMQVQGGES